MPKPTTTISDEKRAKLRATLRATIGERRIQRSSKKAREQVLEQTLAEAGLDKDKFVADMERVQKECGGNLEINYKR